jgi:hypothetical protein
MPDLMYYTLEFRVCMAIKSKFITLGTMDWMYLLLIVKTIWKFIG